MKLKNKLVLSYTIIAVFLVAALIIAFQCCELFCKMNLSTKNNGGMTLFILFAAIALAFALCFAMWFATKLSNPLKALTAKTQDIANGHYHEKITLTTNTVEIDGLIASVNNLAATLQEQQEIKARMANDYAHEIRTPLAAIQSNIEGIIDGIFEPSTERLNSIRAEILRLSRMVSQIDKLTAIERDSTPLTKEPFDMSELLTQTANTFEAEIKEKEITLKTSSEPCEITANRDQIASVIVNLLSNAIKYTDRGGNIGIHLADDHNTATLTVTDSGTGISDSDLPHIFEHLYRTDASRTRETGGSGIGLSVVKAIVCAHGGTIDVKSQAGSGSTFTVTLPKEL